MPLRIAPLLYAAPRCAQPLMLCCGAHPRSKRRGQGSFPAPPLCGNQFFTRFFRSGRSARQILVPNRRPPDEAAYRLRSRRNAGREKGAGAAPYRHIDRHLSGACTLAERLSQADCRSWHEPDHDRTIARQRTSCLSGGGARLSRDDRRQVGGGAQNRFVRRWPCDQAAAGLNGLRIQGPRAWRSAAI